MKSCVRKGQTSLCDAVVTDDPHCVVVLLHYASNQKKKVRLSSQLNFLKRHITKYKQTLQVVLLVHKDTGINIKCTKQIGLTAFIHYEIMSHHNA